MTATEHPTSTDKPHTVITLRQATRFFMPLIFMTELNMISKSVIHAFLARLANPATVLAGFSISFAFYYTVTSPTEISTLLSISYLRSRRALRHLLWFFCLVLALPMALVWALAFTPLGDLFYGRLFGATEDVIAQAKLATFMFSLSAPILLARALAFALLLRNHRTVLITYSTLLRLASLGASLVLLPMVMAGPTTGAAMGALALVLCMLVETTFAWSQALRYYRALPEHEDTPLPAYRELWRFSWPLMINQASEMGVYTLINIFLGRLAAAELALASFGVVHGLASLMLSPLRNLVQTAQTLAHSWADVAVLYRFTHRLVLFFTVVVALVFLIPPTRAWVLNGVMGLTPELAAYSAPGVMIVFFVAAFWGYAALGRGLLAGARRTGRVAVSAVSRLGLVCLVGLGVLLFPGVNGCLFGIAAWGLTFLVEAALLNHRVHQGRTEEPSFFAGTV